MYDPTPLELRLLAGEKPAFYSVYSAATSGGMVQFWGNTPDGHVGVVEVSLATIKRLFGGMRQGSWMVGLGTAPKTPTEIRQGAKARYARPYAGSNRYMPLTWNLVQDGVPEEQQPARQPGKFVATYAWLDPEPERHYLHLVCLAPRGGIGYCNLWLKDLERIMRVKTSPPVLFCLSPDVTTLEATGFQLIDQGLLPRDWTAALKRNPPHVEPGRDCRRKEIIN